MPQYRYCPPAFMPAIIWAIMWVGLAEPAAAEPADSRQAELTHLVKHDCGSCHGMTMKGGLGPAAAGGIACGQGCRGFDRDRALRHSRDTDAPLGIRACARRCTLDRRSADERRDVMGAWALPIPLPGLAACRRRASWCRRASWYRRSRHHRRAGAGCCSDHRDNRTNRYRQGRKPGRSEPRLDGLQPRWTLCLRLRTRWRAQQDRSAKGAHRPACAPGRQRHWRRYLPGWASGRCLELRAGGREGLRCGLARAGCRHSHAIEGRGASSMRRETGLSSPSGTRTRSGSLI